MQATTSTFVITREAVAVDSKTLITEGIQIGRLASCELYLNDTNVSRVHAGLKEVNGRFYIYNFSPAGDTLLNGRDISAGEAEALADGDVVQIGPFSLYLQPRQGVLNIHVTRELALPRGETGEATTMTLRPTPRIEQTPDVANALQIYWGRRKREEGKIYPRSFLRPKPRTRLGKAQFNWMPTRDLVATWPKAIIPWSLLVVALLSFVALVRFPEFFSVIDVVPDRGNPSVRRPLQGLLPYRLLLYGAGGALLTIIVGGAARAVRDAVRLRRMLEHPSPAEKDESVQHTHLSKELREKYDPDGPNYPHPVVIADRCIGCHACVDACPHDVLTMVDYIAVPVANDQCMEDTSCQVVCPVSPKACIVVNTTKIIKPRPAPNRDATYMTNVPGCYLIGDVSGQPLIKNAVNEGVAAMHDIASKLNHGGSSGPEIAFDVAIIGAGPAGLSAAIMAKQRGMRYVVLEQDKVLSTVREYPKGKYVFLLPESIQMYGSLAVHRSGITREELLESWARAIRDNGLMINEYESCKGVKKAKDGDYFIVQTEKGSQRETMIYSAYHVVLALGNRGMPMRLRVPGEEIRLTRNRIREDKVRYKLRNPEDYRRKKIIVVGAGNTAIEAAVDLVARRQGDQIEFRPPEEINDVTLVVRSGFTNDIKFVNKRQAYDCIDEGKIKIFYDAAVKEIKEDEVILMNVRTGKELSVIENDYIFVLIGGERPTKFLQSIGITIPFS